MNKLIATLSICWLADKMECRNITWTCWLWLCLYFAINRYWVQPSTSCCVFHRKAWRMLRRGSICLPFSTVRLWQKSQIPNTRSNKWFRHSEAVQVCFSGNQKQNLPKTSFTHALSSSLKQLDHFWCTLFRFVPFLCQYLHNSYTTFYQNEKCFYCSKYNREVWKRGSKNNNWTWTYPLCFVFLFKCHSLSIDNIKNIPQIIHLVLVTQLACCTCAHLTSEENITTEQLYFSISTQTFWW